MKIWKVALVLGLFVAAASPALAADEGKNFIRFGAQYVTPTGEYKDPTGFTISAKDAVGIAVQFEHKFNGRFGLEFGLGFSNHDVEVKGGGISTTVADTTLMPLSIAANFHVLKDKKADLFLGPQIAYVSYGDLTFKGPAAGTPPEGLKSDFGYGVVIGLDVPFGSGKWGFSTQLRYLQTQATEDIPVGAIDIDINPVAVQVAAVVKF